jgi:hypothetical protein
LEEVNKEKTTVETVVGFRSYEERSYESQQ